MKSTDVALIQRILAGDENAFASLIRKYQKQIHTLAWEKTRDFQIAEDIVQETFLQVYQKLNTLEDPTQFTRWLHQIANRRCIAWFRRNRIQTEPLEEIDISEIETEAYSRYIAAEHAKTTADAERDLVETLLAKLKESDRTVITLHYFEEMSSPEIGELLDVSENTVKSRLHRARQQLKKYEFMIQEVLDIKTEQKHRSETQTQGENSMSEETRDETKTEARLKENYRVRLPICKRKSEALHLNRTHFILITWNSMTHKEAKLLKPYASSLLATKGLSRGAMLVAIEPLPAARKHASHSG